MFTPAWAVEMSTFRHFVIGIGGGGEGLGGWQFSQKY